MWYDVDKLARSEKRSKGQMLEGYVLRIFSGYSGPGFSVVLMQEDVLPLVVQSCF